MQELAGQDAQTTVYRSTREQIRQRLEDLGGLMASCLATYSPADSPKYGLLEKVFTEQYTTGEDDDDDDDEAGQVTPREAQQRTGRNVDTCYADGAYNRSIKKEKEAGQEHVEMVLSGIQGAPSCFELTETEQGVSVHDTKTGTTHQAVPARRQKNSTEQRWRIRLDE